MTDTPSLSRRALLGLMAATGAAAVLAPSLGRAQAGPPLTRPIPSSGEALPAVGLGSWITFNVGDDPVLRDECADVMAAFFEAGGRMIDSSPMYGSSQAVIAVSGRAAASVKDRLAGLRPAIRSSTRWNSLFVPGRSMLPA